MSGQKMAEVEEREERAETVPLPDSEFKDQLAQVIPHLRAFGRSLSSRKPC